MAKNLNHLPDKRNSLTLSASICISILIPTLFPPCSPLPLRKGPEGTLNQTPAEPRIWKGDSYGPYPYGWSWYFGSGFLCPIIYGPTSTAVGPHACSGPAPPTFMKPKPPPPPSPEPSPTPSPKPTRPPPKEMESFHEEMEEDGGHEHEHEYYEYMDEDHDFENPYC